MKRFLSDAIRAVLIALVISVVAVLIFAVVLKYVEIGIKGILIVNAVIKVFSIFFGTLIAVREGKNGLIKGALIGILFAVISYLLFALTDGGFDGASFTLADGAVGLISGIISGIFAVNVKKDV
jgi:putative membrane protein, TIGR04086 family/integral membrane protein, TIGR04097 family